MGSQTHPVQHVEFGVNTNSSNHNFSNQTESISNQSTNTHYFNETASTQTKPLNFSTQTTNTPYFNTIPNSTQTTSTQNPTSTQTGSLKFSTTQPAKEEDCQCEDNKPLLPFQSNFARQLHESEVMRSRPPLAKDKRAHQQMEIKLNEPRHQIDYNQPNSLQYTSPLIHKTPQ